MNVKYCSVTGCCNSTMLGRKKKLFFEIPKTEPLRKIWSKSQSQHNDDAKSSVRYFCEDHFNPDDIKGDGFLKIFAAPVCNIPDVKSNLLVYSNRRKSVQLPKDLNIKKRIIHAIREAPTYTLDDDGPIDNTVLNLVFHNFDEDESTYHEDIKNDVHFSEYTNQDEDDCFITNDLPPTIIDLSDDTKNNSEDTTNMIELILCNDIETDEYREKVNDIESYYASESHQFNSATSSIDLTIEEASAVIEIIGDELITHTQTIDLTEELCSDEDDTIIEDNEDTSASIIKKIKQNLVNKHPKSLKSIQENRENGVLEIEISKDASFKSDEDFQQHLMKVVELVQQSKREGEVLSESVEREENQSADVGRYKDPAWTLQQIKVVPLTRLQPPQIGKEFQKRVLNKNLSLKTYDPVEVAVRKEISENIPVICLDNENSDDSYDVQDTYMQSTELVGNVREYNTSQMRLRTNLYMGVSTESLHIIENMLSDCFKTKYSLIFLLRKIKLNESFSTLSDILCWNRNYCKDLYQTLLPKLSNTLSCFLQWPTNCRDSRGIADIFEIEIEKPSDFVEQNLSFCKRRKRYFVKLLISITITGYITYVSVPFYTIQPNTLNSCLDSMPKICSTLVVNPILTNFLSTEAKSTNIVSFDSNCNADRQIIKMVFQRLRRFSAAADIPDMKNLKFIGHVVIVVASLCNLNHK